VSRTDDEALGEVLIEGLPEGVTDEGGGGGNIERCPTCNRPVDEFEGMTEEALLAHLRAELLRDLARGFRNGTITHQEKAVLTRLLKDNNAGVPKDVLDDDIPTREGSTPLPSEPEYPTGDYGATEGG
jgi:hypothetical protein